MTDQMNDGTEQGQESEGLKALRTAADAGTRATRENAFLRAGVDIDSTLGGMFANSYGGDLNKDAITAAWTALKDEVAPTPPAGDGDTPDPAAVAAQAAADEAARAAQTQQDAARRAIGSTPSDPTATTHGGDQVDRAFDQFHQDLKDGLDRESAAATVTEAILKAGIEGDPKRNWTGWTPEQLGQR